MTWIKFCATTNLADAESTISAGANALGFIFAPGARRVKPALAGQIVAALPAEMEKIGVFVNETPQRVAEMAVQVGLTGVQLHGDEPAHEIPEFRRALGHRRIIKSLQARQLLMAGYGTVLMEEFLQHTESLDAILLDSGSPEARGGTGKPFDWQLAVPLVTRIRADMPVIIAGGLNPENVGEAIRLFEPWGVDVVSGVETEVGKKDEAKLRAFTAAVRAASPAAKPA
jgi:phosphoribosylanthranilate isomerase